MLLDPENDSKMVLKFSACFNKHFNTLLIILFPTKY